MSTKNCVLCSKPVKDCLVEEIKPTICCKECCENVSVWNGRKICNTFNAMSRFDCRKVDLQRLNSICVPDPYARRSYRKRFYLTAEVKHLGELATSLKEQRANLKRQREEDERLIKRQRLETRHGIVVQEILPILRPFVLGDYLKSAKSKTLLRDVKQRYSLKDRASELMDSCKAHPFSAMDFCIDHPNGTVETYLELKENTGKVFLIEGNRIMQLLSCREKEMLKGTILEDVLVRSQIPLKNERLFKKLEEQVGTVTAGKIIHYSACQQRIKRGGKVAQVAKKLVAFWKSKDNEEERRLELRNALMTHHVKVKRKAIMYRDYIRGRIDVDLDEVVGALAVDGHLKRICQAGWPNYFRSSQAEFRRCFIEKKLSLAESIDITMKKTQESIDEDRAFRDRFRKDTSDEQAGFSFKRQDHD